jgi:hypothetical protein
MLDASLKSFLVLLFIILVGKQFKVKEYIWGCIHTLFVTYERAQKAIKVFKLASIPALAELNTLAY